MMIKQLLNRWKNVMVGQIQAIEQWIHCMVLVKNKIQYILKKRKYLLLPNKI